MKQDNEPEQWKPYNTGSTGPQIAYRTALVRPQAQILLEADNHAQMEAILLALGRAVAAHKSTVKQNTG